MTVRQEALLVALAAPLIATLAVPGGLISATMGVPAWYLLLAAPVCEELLFRWGVQSRLQKCRWISGQRAGISLSNGLTGTVFVLAHLPFQGIRALLILIPALALGRIFEQSGRVTPCILLHGWFNLCWLLAAKLPDDRLSIADWPRFFIELL